MAKLSRNQRHKARQRRTLSILKREFRKLYQAHHNATFALLSLLEDKGGELTITEAMMKAVLPRMVHLSWKSERRENGDVVVTLVDSTPAAEPATPNVTMRYVEEETTGEPEPTDGELLTEALEG